MVTANCTNTLVPGRFSSDDVIERSAPRRSSAERSHSSSSRVKSMLARYFPQSLRRSQSFQKNGDIVNGTRTRSRLCSCVVTWPVSDQCTLDLDLVIKFFPASFSFSTFFCSPIDSLNSFPSYCVASPSFESCKSQICVKIVISVNFFVHEYFWVYSACIASTPLSFFIKTKETGNSCTHWAGLGLNHAYRNALWFYKLQRVVRVINISTHFRCVSMAECRVVNPSVHRRLCKFMKSSFHEWLSGWLCVQLIHLLSPTWKPISLRQFITLLSRSRALS